MEQKIKLWWKVKNRSITAYNNYWSKGSLATNFIKYSGQHVHNEQGFMAWQKYIKKKIHLADLFFPYLQQLQKFKHISDNIFPEITGRKHWN